MGQLMLKQLIAAVLLICNMSTPAHGSIQFNATGERLSDSTPTNLDLTAFTLCAWVYVDTSPAVAGYIFNVQVGAGGHSLLNITSTNQVVGTRTTSSTARSSTSTGTLTAATWYFVCSTYDGAGSAPKVFISSGSSVNTVMTEVSYASQTAGTGTDVTTPTNTLIGNTSAFNRTFLGRIAEVWVYTVELTTAQMNSLARGYPIAGAVCHVPLTKKNTPSADTSGSGNSYAWSTGPTYGEHAPVAPSFGWW